MTYLYTTYLLIKTNRAEPIYIQFLDMCSVHLLKLFLHKFRPHVTSILFIGINLTEIINTKWRLRQKMLELFQSRRKQTNEVQFLFSKSCNIRGNYEFLFFYLNKHYNISFTNSSVTTIALKLNDLQEPLINLFLSLQAECKKANDTKNLSKTNKK